MTLCVIKIRCFKCDKVNAKRFMPKNASKTVCIGCRKRSQSALLTKVVCNTSKNYMLNLDLYKGFFVRKIM